MKPQALSVIIPVYNEENYLFDCLQALASQTIKPHEVIVVDNNSTDNSAAIARRFSFVKLIKEERQGLYFARQAGMNVATGDILCRIDADTIVSIDWLENIKNLFENSHTQLASGPIGFHDFIIPKFTKGLGYTLSLAGRLIGYKFIYGCNMAITKKLWNEIKQDLCNRPDIFEDIDIAIHSNNVSADIVYSRNIGVLVSARRFNDGFKKYTQYISGHTRTLVLHDKPYFGAIYAKWVFILAYILFRRLYIAFDSEKRVFSIAKLFKSSQPDTRPDPMNVN